MLLREWRLVFAWPYVLAIVPTIVLIAVLFERRAGGRGAGRRGVAGRVAIVAAISLALAGPMLVKGSSPALVFVADRSASVPRSALDRALADLGLPRTDATMLHFGDESESPLADALDQAARALPGGGRVILVSDGRFTGRDPRIAAADLAERGLRIDAVPVPPRKGADAAVTALYAPPAWRLGETVPLAVSVRSTAELTGTLTLFADDRPAIEVPVSLGPGLSTVRLPYLPLRTGDIRFRVQISVAGDSEAGNDLGYGVTHVAAMPRILIVGDGLDAVAIADSLHGLGFSVTVMAPQRLPVRLSALTAWDTLMLVDVPGAAMGIDQMAAVESFATDLGRGVVLTAGRQSFLPGGWRHTPLARLAPVTLEPPDRGRREAVALLLMIDQSASMGGVGHMAGITKLDLAREAALLATEALHPGDLVGVIAYDDEARWLVPLAEVGSGSRLAEAEGEIARLVSGGGTRILRALELGLPKLQAVAAPTKHAVLLSDGRDFNPDAAQYRTAMLEARGAGVSLSTIGIGLDADSDLMARLAAWGRGRYHLAEDPADLPRLTAQESEVVRARSEQHGDFRARAPSGQGHPILTGLEPSSLPALAGYLATTPREDAEVALEAPNGDPLLAGWHYGGGRVVAWLSDAGEAWAVGWPDSPAAAAFWARLVRYVARAPEAGPPGVEVSVENARATVAVDAVSDNGELLDLAKVTLVVTRSAVVSYDVPQVAPGRYEVTVLAGEEGAHPAAVIVQDGSRTMGAPAGWVVGYAPELRPSDSGQSTLGAITAASGGRVLEQAPTDLPSGPAERRELSMWLLVLAAALWLPEVARTVGGRP